MATFYTKREACEKLLEGTPAESLARIEAERKGRKYYLLTAYTPYAGEEMDAYISCCEEEDLREFGDELAYECAAEWVETHLEDWWADGYDTYEDAREDYYSGCGYRVREVPKEEYAKASVDDSYWVMRKEYIDG